MRAQSRPCALPGALWELGGDKPRCAGWEGGCRVMLSPSPRCSPAVGDAAAAPVQPVPHQQGEENPAGLGLRVRAAEGGCWGLCSAPRASPEAALEPTDSSRSKVQGLATSALPPPRDSESGRQLLPPPVARHSQILNLGAVNFAPTSQQGSVRLGVKPGAVVLGSPQPSPTHPSFAHG